MAGKQSKSKGSGRSAISRSKGSAHVPNGMATAMPNMAGPLSVPTPGQSSGGPAAPMTAPQMPSNNC